MPENPEVAGILGVEDPFAVAQPRDHRAAGFLAEHVAVGQAPLAPGLFDELRQAARDGAEEPVAGVDDFVRGVVLALGAGSGLGRRIVRRRARGYGRWRPADCPEPEDWTGPPRLSGSRADKDEERAMVRITARIECS